MSLATIRSLRLHGVHGFLLSLALAGATACTSLAQVETPTSKPTETQDPKPDGAGTQNATTQPTKDANQIRSAAFAAEHEGRHAEAAAAFEELTKLDGNNPDWFVRAADNLGQVGRYNDAMDLLNDVRQRFPDVVEIPLTLAQLFHLKADAMLAEGRYDLNVSLLYEDTVNTAEQVLEMAPTNVRAHLLLASGQFQLSKFDAALEAAEKAIELAPGDYGAHAMLGKITLQRFVNAKQRIDRERPTGQTATDLAAEVKAMRDRTLAAFAAASKADPARSFPIVRIGDVHAWSGEMEVALEKYGDALALDPAAAVDHNWLRSAVVAGQRATFYGKALDRYTDSEDAMPELSAVLTWYRAQAHYDARSWQAARAGFESAMKERPDFLVTHYYLMQAAYWMNDVAAAAKHAADFAEEAPKRFADMIRADQQTTAVLRGMAQQAWDGQRMKECRELNRVLAYASNTVDDWNNYALLCRDTGKYQESFDAYEHALKLEQSPQLYNDAAVILQYHLSTAENLDIARGYYERAIAMAEAMLARDDLPKDVRERTQIALRDANMNSRRLGK